MRITREQFKTDYNGSIDALKAKCVIVGDAGEGLPKKIYSFREYDLQVTVAAYLSQFYPDVPFISNPINLNLTKGQRKMNAAIQGKNFKCPDMIIFRSCHGFNGMLLELKKESPYKLDGTLKKNNHLEAQWKAIAKLSLEGFHADFYWEFETIKKAIDWYLG
jgi:hypothetical protein